MVSTLENGTVEIVPDRIEPSVRRADLERIYAKRSSVYTRIDSHSPDNRNDNIRLAFSKINGYVLQPGKTFSFNKVVGNRSTKNGFKTAVEYVYGEHVEGVGGGVCQASTTIYQAAMRANLKIDKRTPHSLAVNYTPYGKDATVYWNRYDFVFTNNTEHPIYIKAAVQSAERNRKNLECKVWIYGEGLGEGVTYEIVTEEIVLPAPEEPDIRRDKDAKFVTYKDEQYEYQKAEDGTEVHRWLVKYENKQEVSRRELETDTYPAKPQIIYVGTRERPEGR
jgi:vancomycin resistance protein YoaR